MSSSSAPPTAPPVFPVFPMPPPQQASAAEAAVEHEALRRHTATGHLDVPQAPNPRSERERIAEEAIRSSIRYVAQEYVRQDIAEQLGLSDEPPATKALECHPGNPQHTAKLCAALLLAFFGVITLLNAFSLTVLIAGCTLVYVSDSLGYQKGSIVVLFLALGAFGLAILITNLSAVSSVGPLCLLINTIVGATSVTAASATIHYRWLQTEFPALVKFLERLSMALAPIVCLPSLMSVSVAFLTAKHAAIGFACGCCVLHAVFFGRNKSSFLFERVAARPKRSNNDDPEDQAADEEVVMPVQLTGREESILFTILALVLPSFAYAFLQSNWDTAAHLHAVNFLAMIGIPVMYLAYNPRESLWFLRPEKPTLRVGDNLQADPFGLWELIVTTRPYIVGAGYFLLLHWGIYRLLHSRYQYLFAGLPPPFNGVVLLVAAYTLTGIIVISKRILDKESRRTGSAAGEHMDDRRFALDRVTVMLLSVVFALLVAAAAGMPQFFYPMSALTASSFNAYLLDRRNSSNFTLFCCCSSLLLMWWMYRTFSFIVMDLRVLGESTSVPTPVVAVSVLWSYLLGCIAFGLSFSENKRPFHLIMFLHALKLAWIEHVLYSQVESGAYPAAYVFLTSGVGVYLCFRLYRSGVMDATAASAVAAAYVAKIFTFLAEISGTYYRFESSRASSTSSDIRRAIEVAVGWWAMLLVAYVTIFLELAHREGTLESASIGTLTTTLLGAAAVVSFASVENLQRAATEVVLQRYITQEEALHASLGLSMIMFAALTTLTLARHSKTFPRLRRLADASKVVGLVGVCMFVFRPTQLLLRQPEGTQDVDLVDSRTGRTLATIGCSLMAAARFLPLLRAPFLVRVAYWLSCATLLTIGLVAMLIPAATKVLALCVGCFVFFTLLTIDVSHYRNLTHSEAWIVYGISVAGMVLSFIALGRLDTQRITGSNLLLMWEMHETGRLTLLGVAAAANIFTAVLLKFRLHGNSLLPGAIPLTHAMIQQVGIIGNYTALLSVVVMTILNVWAGNADPIIFVATSMILLLLVDDDMLFFELHRNSNRYIPVLGYIFASLWGTLIFDAFQFYQEKGQHAWLAIRSILYALPVLPSHVSLLSVLYFGKNRGGVWVAAVLSFCLLDLLCLIFSTRHTVQWMALVGIVGQATRLYEAQFWRKRHDALL